MHSVPQEHGRVAANTLCPVALSVGVTLVDDPQGHDPPPPPLPPHAQSEAASLPFFSGATSEAQLELLGSRRQDRAISNMRLTSGHHEPPV